MKHDHIMMQVAASWATASHATRLKVGAVIARDGRIVATGYNGMPKGMHNCCEDANGFTRPEVIHAEENAILFCAKHGLPADGCEMFTLVAPCVSCARKIIAVGLTRVVYLFGYRNEDGLALLAEVGITVTKLLPEAHLA